ncbi:hypothetical protein SEVIR_4G260100v4 [Setaria viridis]
MMRRLQFLATASFFLLAIDAFPPSMAGAQQLSPDHYADVCPNLESIVRAAVRMSVAHSPVAAPATLRLFFHDCAVRGCDASIMLINPDGDDEWRSLDGMTLKLEGFNTVMSAKAAVDSDPRCRNMVSCADILALAARDSVFLVSTTPSLPLAFALEGVHLSRRIVTVSRVNTRRPRRAEGRTTWWSWAGTTAGCRLKAAS